MPLAAPVPEQLDAYAAPFIAADGHGGLRMVGGLGIGHAGARALIEPILLLRVER
jgi:hypothetical protein